MAGNGRPSETDSGRRGLPWVAATDVGRRERNEDAYAGDSEAPARGVFMVCDGMGGHAGGDTASALAVSVLRWVLEPGRPEGAAVAERIQAAVAAANRAIFDRNEREGTQGRQRAGTTLALVLIADGEAHVAHVGDSRVYVVTAEATSLLTTDHTVVNWEISRGTPAELARKRSDARHLVQALGPFPDGRIRPDLRSCPIVEPAVFVLCTDGVWESDVVEREGPGLLRSLLAPGADLDDGCRRLVAAARQAGGHDNMTALLVRVTPDG
jgi:protein phosphatase